MNFIEKYDGVLPSFKCALLISLFESSADKSAWKLDFGSKNPVNKVIIPSLQPCLEKYKKKYPLLDNLGAWTISHEYYMQRFEKDEDHFVKRCEQSHKRYSERIIVWKIYLNNAKSGTRFHHQKIDMKSREGRIVMWPAAWTHTHSEINPNKDRKYSVSGWFELIEETT